MTNLSKAIQVDAARTKLARTQMDIVIARAEVKAARSQLEIATANNKEAREALREVHTKESMNNNEMNFDGRCILLELI